MITDKKLEQLCLVVVMVGIVILFFAVQLNEPISVNSIDDSLLGRTVSLRGTVNKISTKENTFLNVRTNESIIKVVMFKNISFAVNNTVCVIGNVALYKNELEVIAKSIEVC
jgi:aspartyl/asparaginyl-tRNA synthetase